MENLDTAAVSFLAARCAYLEGTEGDKVRKLSQERLEKCGLDQPDAIKNRLENTGNFYLVHSPVGVHEWREENQYDDSIYLHYDTKNYELLAVIPKKALKVNFCIRNGCCELSEKKKIFCRHHMEMCMEEDDADDGKDRNALEEEKRILVAEFHNEVGPTPHDYHGRKCVLEDLIRHIIIGSAVNTGRRRHPLVDVERLWPDQVSILCDSLKVKVFSTKFAALGWDPVEEIPIYRFVDEGNWKKFCSGESTFSMSCLNPVTRNSEYCPFHGPRQRESRVIAMILELSEVDYIHQLSEERFELFCTNLSKFENRRAYVHGEMSELFLETDANNCTLVKLLEYKKKATSPEVKTVCPNLFRGFECNKIFTKHCPNCEDHGLGYTVYILRPIYYGSPELRNVFVIQISKNRKRGGASVNAENFNARLEDFGHPTNYDSIKICMAKFAATKEDAIEMKTACIYYIQIEGHCAQKRVHVCVSSSPLGTLTVQKLQALLREIELKLVPVNQEVDISNFPEDLRTFHYANSTENVRSDTVIARIFQISAEGSSFVYNGIEYLTGNRLDARQHATLKIDEITVRKIPMENRTVKTLVTVPLSKRSVRASNSGVETLILTAYKFAEEIGGFNEEIQVNASASSYYWDWFWFLELQLFQQKHFGFHTKLISTDREISQQLRLVGRK